jgi:hypothetical protein
MSRITIFWFVILSGKVADSRRFERPFRLIFNGQGFFEDKGSVFFSKRQDQSSIYEM